MFTLRDLHISVVGMLTKPRERLALIASRAPVCFWDAASGFCRCLDSDGDGSMVLKALLMLWPF